MDMNFFVVNACVVQKIPQSFSSRLDNPPPPSCLNKNGGVGGAIFTPLCFPLSIALHIYTLTFYPYNQPVLHIDIRLPIKSLETCSQ